MTKKLMLSPTFLSTPPQLKINEFKAFAFIDSDQVNAYEELGFDVTIDDEVNQIYYAEFIHDDMVTLNCIYDECINRDVEFILEYDNEYYNMDEVKTSLY